MEQAFWIKLVDIFRDYSAWIFSLDIFAIAHGPS